MTRRRMIGTGRRRNSVQMPPTRLTTHLRSSGTGHHRITGASPCASSGRRPMQRRPCLRGRPSLGRHRWQARDTAMTLGRSVRPESISRSDGNPRRRASHMPLGCGRAGNRQAPISRRDWA